MASLMRSGRQASKLLLRSQYRLITRSSALCNVIRLPQVSVSQARPFSNSIHRYQQAEATAPVPEGELSSFKDLAGIIHPNVLDTITSDMGLVTMTEVQQRTLKEALTHNDM
jgi:hypothetical protein